MCFCLLIFSTQIYAQSGYALEVLKKAARDTIDSFAPADRQMLVGLRYGEARPRPGEHSALDVLSPVSRIRLYYSIFPVGNDGQQNVLNQARVEYLLQQYPFLSSVPVSAWELVAQKGCSTETEARGLFHGFVLEFNDRPAAPDFLQEDELLDLTEGDSTLFKIVERQQSWSRMLVVTDLTASMAPYTAQLLIWFKLNEQQQMVEHFVFFNDGDLKTTAEKQIGETGGIYAGPAATFEEAASLAQNAVNNGYGGDLPENNLEALIKGIEACPECEDVVMIADNKASPRDMELLPRIDRPVRLVLCGTEAGINQDYLNIAFKTGGSLHTIEQDIENLVKVNEGESVTIGDEIFIIKDGEFKFLKKT